MYYVLVIIFYTFCDLGKQYISSIFLSISLYRMVLHVRCLNG